MDTLSIVDLELRIHIGVKNAERTESQRVLVNIDLHRSTRRAGVSDDLKDTIDYVAVADAVKTLTCHLSTSPGETHEWKTIERLAEDIAELVLRDFHPDAVTVSVAKCPPIGTKEVRCTIHRP